MPSQTALLGAARLTGIMQGLQSPQNLPQPTVWVGKRVPIVPAYDEEIMARFIGTPTIADIIADDAKAVTYTQGKWQTEVNKIPNLKFGIAINQAALNMLDRLTNGYAMPDDSGMFTDWTNRTMEDVRNGVLMRMEVLTVAMLLDSLNYNRLGVNLSGVTWGMPSDLKVTPGTGWDTAGSATPVSDMWGVKLTAAQRYGINLDRVTMSTTAFRYMIATTEFQAKARQYLAPNVSYSNLTISNLDQQKTIAQNAVGLQIELDDRRVWQQDVTGTTTSFAIQPVAQVLMTSTQNDGSRLAYDFANGIVTESIVGNAIGVIGGIPNRVRGPIAYATLADSMLNPPGKVVWGIGRGFPRKMQLQSSAVLTVGTFTESISPSILFPA